MEATNLSELEQAKRTRNPADFYLNSLGSERSAITMRSCLNRIAQYLGVENYSKMDWTKFRRAHWFKVSQNLKAKGTAPSTMNLYLASVKGVLREAWSLGMMGRLAYEKIENIKSLRYERRPTGRSLTLRECRKLLNSCNDGTLKGKRDKAIFAVMMGCGLRRSEVVGLNLLDWDNKEKSFTFIGKGNKERTVYLPTDLLTAIEDWLEARGNQEGAFFPRMRSGHGKDDLIFSHMISGSIYRILDKRCQEIGLAGIRPHDLRRTFATRMLENRCDLFLLQAAMGHSNVSTTARYDKRTEKSREKFCRSLRF